MPLDQLINRISAEFWDAPPPGVTPSDRVNVEVAPAQFGALVADWDARGRPSTISYNNRESEAIQQQLYITVFHARGLKFISVQPLARDNGTAKMRNMAREVAL